MTRLDQTNFQLEAIPSFLLVMTSPTIAFGFISVTYLLGKLLNLALITNLEKICTHTRDYFG